MTTDTNDFWRPFSESKWRDLAQTVSASELQLKFAVARFNGASATAAAKIAGYAGDDDAIRRAGYSAVRSAAVVALLDLAAVNAPEENELTDREVDQKVAKLVRSADPRVAMAAAELYDKRKQRKQAAIASQPEETPEQSLAFIITAVPTQGVGAYLALCSFVAAGGPVANFPFIAEIAPTIAHHYPADWSKWTARSRMTDFLVKLASAPVPSDDELVAAVKAKLGPSYKPEVIGDVA